MPGAYCLVSLMAVALAGCQEEGAPGLPAQSQQAIASGVDAMLAGCTGPLASDGNIGEEGLRAAQWVPVKRVQMDVVDDGKTVGTVDKALPPQSPAVLSTDRQSEYSDWIHAGVAGSLYLTRFGGAVGTQNASECTMAFQGKEDRTAEAIRKQLVAKYGAPRRVGTRSSGGDHLTPRFGDKEIHAQYWQLPKHDIYWVSSAGYSASIEVVGMPDRAKLDPTSSAQPMFRAYIPEQAQ